MKLTQPFSNPSSCSSPKFNLHRLESKRTTLYTSTVASFFFNIIVNIILKDENSKDTVFVRDNRNTGSTVFVP